MDLYPTRIVPFTVYKEVIKKGKKYTEDIENITVEESRNMSCMPVMLWREKGTDYYYLAELPLYATRGTSVKGFMCYLYEDLNDKEKELFKDRTIEIPLTRKDVTQVYPKKKVRK